MTTPCATARTLGSRNVAMDVARPEARVTELSHERDHPIAITDILQDISKKLGSTSGLDRCSIFLAGERSEVRRGARSALNVIQEEAKG